ncbi:MAG: prefoldin subunit [Nanoarchaeota archaeon]
MVSQEKIQELQQLEQHLQSYAQQKRAYQTQEMELDSALEALKTTSESYKIIGNIMVASPAEKLQGELSEKQALTKKRIESLEKHEKTARERYQKIHEELSEMHKKEQENKE